MGPSQKPPQFQGVQQIQAARDGAFAAILEDGSVLTWGDPRCGGDSSAVGDQLRGVRQIQCTGGAFAAILEDGSVICWGHSRIFAYKHGRARAVPSPNGFCRNPLCTWVGSAGQIADAWWLFNDFQVCYGNQSHWWYWMSLRANKHRQTLLMHYRWRSAQNCAEDTGHMACICCDSGRWIRRHLGFCTLWRWQFGSSAQECAPDSGNRTCIGCDFGRWISH